MTFNDYCRYMADKYGLCVCDDPKFLRYVENNVPNYRTRVEDYTFWEGIYTIYKR